MATKYSRETEVRTGIEGRRTPWMRQGPPQHPLSRGQRIFLLIMGLAVVGLLAQIAYQLNHGAPYLNQPLLSGVGIIMVKQADAAIESSGKITLAIDVDGPEELIADWHLVAPYWNRVSVGDRLAIRYRLSKRRVSIDIVECSMVALP